jgi:hypothetical protein
VKAGRKVSGRKGGAVQRIATEFEPYGLSRGPESGEIGRSRCSRA